MRPKLNLLDAKLVDRILEEAFELLERIGARVGSADAIELVGAAGARIEGDIVRLPRSVVRHALQSAPHEFSLYSRSGQASVHYGGDDVHFDNQNKS